MANRKGQKTGERGESGQENDAQSNGSLAAQEAGQKGNGGVATGTAIGAPTMEPPATAKGAAAFGSETTAILRPGNLAVDRVLAAGAEPFCDKAGMLRLRMPQEESETSVRAAWPIRSRRTEAWIAALFYEQGQAPLSARELYEALLILEGQAQKNEPETELLDLIEREPLLDALIAHCEELEEGEQWNCTATGLLNMLRERAVERGVDVDRDERWPKDGSHLSLQLQAYTTYFKEIGISYTRSRDKRQRLHILSLER